MKQEKKPNSIAFKLVSGFMVVIVLIIVLGIVSYNRSSKAMLDSYEKNMTGTVNATATYLDLGMNQVRAEAQKIIENNDFYNYYRGAYKNDKPREYMMWSSLYNTVQSAASASDIIMSISVFGDYGDGMSSAGTLENGFYEIFKQSFSQDAQDGVWLSSPHEELDKEFHIDQSRYAASYVQSFVNFNGYVVIDINAKAVKTVLNNLNLDQRIIIGYVAPDGTEILNREEEEQVFSNTDFYQKAKSGGSQSAFVKYNNENCLFVYSPIADTGAGICTLVPEKVMLAQAKEIRNITIGIVIVAIIIAVCIALYFALNIHKSISMAIAVLEKASEGDLTGNVTMKGNDEFSTLGSSINSMISSMKGLLIR